MHVHAEGSGLLGPFLWFRSLRALPLSLQDLPAVTVNPIKLETGLRPKSAGIPYTLLLRTEATGFPTFGLLL